MADATTSSAVVVGVITLLWCMPVAMLVVMLAAIAGLAIARGARLVGPRLGRRVARRPTTYLACFAGLGVVLSVVLGSVVWGFLIATIATASIAAATDA
jgi:hypothetical protein